MNLSELTSKALLKLSEDDKKKEGDEKRLEEEKKAQELAEEEAKKEEKQLFEQKLSESDFGNRFTKLEESVTTLLEHFNKKGE